MENKTAVEWLIEQIIKYKLIPKTIHPNNVLFHEAKVMEKEQLEDSWKKGFDDATQGIKEAHKYQ